MPNRSEETDRLMMDFLYEELSDTEAAEFEAKLVDSPDLSAELEGHRRTRDAFSALPDEEPPDRLTAILLHEAAKRAPAGRRRAVTVEERATVMATIAAWFRPVWSHPAAMSMAALVVVVGVAGALYVRGLDSAVQPAAPTSAPAPSAATAAETGRLALSEESATDSEGLFELQRDAPALAANQADELKPAAGVVGGGDSFGRNAALADEADEQALRQQQTARAPRQDAGKRSKTGYSYRSELGPAKSGAKRGKARAVKPDEAMANAVSGADPLIVAEDAELDETEGVGGEAAKDSGRRGRDVASTESSRENRSANVPARRTASGDFDDANVPTGARRARGAAAAPPPEPAATPSAPLSKPERKRLEQSKSLHGQLGMTLDNPRKRSKKVKCQDAARIANDLLDKDRDYYYAKVAKDKRLQQCSWYVRDETKKRERKRAAAKTKRRAKEAPAPAAADQAVEGK